MKKLLKKKLFWAIIIVVIIVASFILKGGNKSQPEYLTAVVERGNLLQTVSATGKVESASETNLNFTNSGNLAKLYASVGERVTAGQLLAELSLGQVSSNVTAARAQVTSAQADLDSIKAGSSNEDISVSQAKVASAEADLAATNETLIHAQTEREQNILSLKEQALNKVSESVFTSKQSLDHINDFINESTYDTQLNVFIFSLNSAKSSYANAKTIVDLLEKDYKVYSIANTPEELIVLLDRMNSALNSVDAALDSTFDLLSKISAGGSLTQTILDSVRTDIVADQTAIAAKISAVQTAKSNLQTDVLEYDNAVESAQSNVTKAEAALSVSRAELELKSAGPRDFQISLYQAKLLQAQANLQKALADLGDYRLKAPIDGLISKINYEIGEFVGSATPLITLIGESNLQIEVDVPESDIAKIRVGDEASITLDAFGDDVLFDGHITFVDPAETVINDVVYYKVKTSFDHKEEGVKSGMTANVIVKTASRDNILYIPARAVIENGRRIVRVIKDGQINEKEVTTGLRGDDGLIEILSGLEEGESVVTYIKNGN
jgi:HlyD family secretion protein